MPKLSKLTSITSSSTPSAPVAVLPLQACGPTSMKRADLWASYIGPIDIPKYDPHSYRKLSGISASILTGLRDTHYGEFGTGTPAPNVQVDFSYKWKPTSKFKAFAAAKARGDIVLNPMTAYSGYVLVGSGAWLGSATNPQSYSVEHSSTAKGFPAGPTGCANYPFATTYGDLRVSGSTLRGGDLTTKYNYTVFDVPSVGAAITAKAAGQFYQEIVDALNKCTVDTSLVTATRAEASQGLLDLTTTLAEAPETIREIFAIVTEVLNRFVSVKRKIRKLRKKDFASLLEYGNTVSSMWLQYRYSIMPNVYAVQDLLAYLNTETAFYQTVRQGENYSIELPQIAGWSAMPIDVRHRCFFKNRFDASVSKREMYLKTSAFGTAYELVPLSFVLDWFINVGDMLAAMAAPQGSVQEASMYSFAFDGTVLYTNPSWIGPPIRVKLKYYRAETIIPDTEIGFALQFNVNWKRWLDALALTWSFTKGNHKQLLRNLR